MLLDHTVTTPYRWERQPVDLSEFGGRTVQLSLSLVADAKGIPGFWGTPVIRTRTTPPREAPQGVILIQADTLRPDHLGLYGHKRDTTPFLSQLASEGAVFENTYAQAGWTKVSTPSIMTSLYPSTHGDRQLQRPPAGGCDDDCGSVSGRRLCDAVALVGDVHRAVHEPASGLRGAARADLGPAGSGPARTRARPPANTSIAASDWIERHRDEPFFVYLHVFDPHSPYEPQKALRRACGPTSRNAREHIKQRDATAKSDHQPVHGRARHGDP